MNLAFLKRRWRALSLGSAAIVLLIVVGWVIRLDRQMQRRLERGWFLPPLELYSAPLQIRLAEPLTHENFAQRLAHFKLRERQVGQPLQEGDWVWLPADSCGPQFSQIQWPDQLSNCAVLHLRPSPALAEVDRWRWIALDAESRVIALWTDWPAQSATQISLDSELFAQYYQDQPILRTVVDIGEVPLDCLQAATAIEDSDFLAHRGISPSAVARALLRNLVSGRFAQGGSTITQQLIKNYFLTSEKTLARKLTEQAMAVLLEARHTKDEILASYLNVIYMGQSGPFQVRGFAAASEYFFGRELNSLGLNECSLLAAIINNPGRYHPGRHPEAARQRRNLVLQRMSDLGMIDAESAAAAKAAPLAVKESQSLSEPAPFFVQAVLKEVVDLGLDPAEGLRIYTTLDLQTQEIAQTLLASETSRLEKTNAHLRARSDQTKPLQSSAILVDHRTGGVLALVGGRQFRITQFNRVTTSHRQPGSLFKPLVYLSAFENETPQGKPYSPMTLLEDRPWTYKYEGQEWVPKNYDAKFRGPLPLFYALAHSLNVPTAKLATEIGLSNVIDLAHRMGVSSELQPVPSLALGAFEVTPWEIAQTYTTLARFGAKIPLHLLTRITSPSGDLLYEPNLTVTQVARLELVASIVGMMKHTFSVGTARGAKSLGFDRPAAGKTGSTSDSKDAWFAGFTPDTLGVVWVGFDDNTPSGLTGASGALPIWVSILKRLSDEKPVSDFAWPAEVIRRKMSADQLRSVWPTSDTPPESEIELIFSKEMLEN